MGLSDTWQSLSGCKSDQKNDRGKIPRDDTSKINPSTVVQPQRRTDKFAGLEPGTSVTGILAEVFRKKSVRVHYALLV